MSIPYDATCGQCRFCHGRRDPSSGEDWPSGECHGLPPDGQPAPERRVSQRRLKDARRIVAKCDPACSLFETGPKEAAKPAYPPVSGFRVHGDGTWSPLPPTKEAPFEFTDENAEDTP